MNLGKKEPTIAAYFLGGVKIFCERQILTGFATQKSLGLLCYILDNHPDPVSRDKLMAIFWGETPEDQARYNLRFALWNIRKAAKIREEEADLLLTSRNFCQINPEYKVFIDANEFASFKQSYDARERIPHLEKVLDLYKGPFLDGFTLRNLPDWEEWLANRRETLHQTFINYSLEFGEHLLKTGDAEKAVNVYLKVLSFDAFNEGAHLGLIRAYADQSRFPAALRQFEIYTEALKRGYKVAPNPEIIKLCESIRNRTYKPSHQQNIEIINLSEPLTPSREIISDTELESLAEDAVKPSVAIDKDLSLIPFIGRTQELEKLSNIIQELSKGRGMVLIITGEMGIGKTRLFKELMKMVTDDFFVGYGEAQETEGSFPYESLLQIFESFGSNNRLPPELKNELNELSQLRYNIGEIGLPTQKLNERLLRWTINLTQQAPVIIAIDDLHWATESLLTTFTSLAQETKRRPILLIGIYRTYETQSEKTLGGILINLARTGRLYRIDLSELSLDETSKLIYTVANEVIDKFKSEEIERLCRFCEGIPLYAIEIAGFLQEGFTEFMRSPRLEDQPDFSISTEKPLVPPLMLKIADFKLQSLQPEVRELIKVTSLLLGDFSLNLLNKLSKFDQEQLEEVLIELENRNIYQHYEKVHHLSFNFSHQMLKLAFSELIPTLEKRRIYARIAKTLSECPDEVYSETLAFYLYNAGERAASVPYLLKGAKLRFNAGDKNTGLGYARIAYETAKELFDAAPELLPQAIQIYSDQLQQIGNIKQAIEELNNAINIIENSTFIKGKPELSAKREELKKLLQREPDKEKRDIPLLALVATRRALAGVKFKQGDPVSAETLLDQAEKILDLLNSPPAMRETALIFMARAEIYLHSNQLKEASILTEDALEILKKFGTDEDIENVLTLQEEINRKQNL